MAEQFHWDPHSYLELVRSEMPDYDELQDALVAATVTVRPARILDLGTGTGVTARRVLDAHPDATLVGVDDSAEMLAQAADALGPNADLRQGRLEEPLPSGPFDLVISALAIHHLDGPGKADLFGRVARVLAAGGRFVLADVVVPDDPADCVVPLDDGYDQPSRTDEQIDWLAAAWLAAEVTWARRDLAVLTAVRPV